jgi:replicative DNA helicase
MNIEVKEKQEDTSLDVVIDNFMTTLEKKAAGKIKEIKTGIFDLDNLTGGLHGGEITIIAARPSVGKTAFAMALIQKIAFDFPCLMFNLEMSKEQIMSRMVSAIGNINSARLRNPKFLDDNENKDINRAINYIGDKLKLKLYDNIYTVEKIRTITREQKPDVIFIDYLTLCSSIRRHESKRQEIEYISREFKKMSKEFNIPVVVLSQLNRANEKDNREPQLYDLRETGAIEQDADNVIMLHGKMNDFGEYEPELKLLVRKQRNGAIGCVKVLFDRARYQFKNMAR